MRFSQYKLAKLFATTAVGVFALVGCRKEDMSDQPKFYKPYKETAIFADGTSARPLPPGTVARGHLRLEEDLYTGKVGGKEIDYFPIPIAEADLQRGQQKFMIYCSLCHGAKGDGQGMIVKRGFVQPPSFVRLDNPPADPAQRERNDRVRTSPVGHYYDVITNGYGAMFSHNDRVSVDDRWRIAAYIRALQLSQDAGSAAAARTVAPTAQANASGPETNVQNVDKNR
jgi:mono/diheme cytochrome c family protein